MRKLMKWVIPVCLGILPALGADGIVKIEDPFFTKTSGKGGATIVHLSELIQKKDGTLQMTIEGNDTKETRELKVKPSHEVTDYEEDDDTKTYKEIVKASVKCGSTILSDTITLSATHDYDREDSEINFINGSPVVDFALPLGEIADVRNETIFTKPKSREKLKKRGGRVIGQVTARGLHDGEEITTPKQFLKLGVETIDVRKTVVHAEDSDTETQATENDPVIYELFLKTQISPAGADYYCVDHNFDEPKTGWGSSEKRCCWATYAKFKVTNQVWKRTSDGEKEALLYTNPDIVEYQLFEESREQRSTKTNRQKNQPGNRCIQENRRDLPTKHRIVTTRPKVTN